MFNLEVKISEKEKSYPIVIENSSIKELRAEIEQYLGNSRFLAVISEKVYKLYGKDLNIARENLFILKDGEKEKNFKTYQKILDRALRMNLTRKDALIAIGGGVCGDITGFAAATYMRGINYIQIPTTLLACVDSSVGGKTGIDTAFGKNLVGAFYQPKAVIINANFLKTLDKRQFKTGLGEVIKYSFIEKSCQCSQDYGLTNFLDLNFEKILSYDSKTLQELINICLNLKISVVEKDEKEGNLRKILNFGHTYGHAVERITNYRKYTHGEAIVKGIEIAFDIAVKKNLIDVNYKFIALDLIKKFNFKSIRDYDVQKMVNLMKLDKKAQLDDIIFVLPNGYSTVIECKFSPEELFQILKSK